MGKTVVRRILLGVVGLGVVGALVWAFLPAPAGVDLAPVTRGPMRVTVDQQGRTRVRDRYVVSAPLAGHLYRIGLKAGDAIEANRIVAVLEPTDPALLDPRARAEAEARVQTAEEARAQAAAALDKAKIAEKFAQSEHARARRMIVTGSISRQELEDAERKERTTGQDVKMDQFGLRVADFKLAEARAALVRTRPGSPGEPNGSRFEVRAPIQGRVLRILQESEGVVTPGQPLLEVGEPAEIEVAIDVLSADAVKVRPGALVLLEHWGGDAPLTARVRVVEPGAFTKTSALGVEEQRVWVVADLEDPPERRPTLGDGYRVEARIVVWEAADVLKVPAGALVRRGDNLAVFVADGGRARLRPIVVGHNNGLEAEVLDGLHEGDAVVVHPSDKVSDGGAIAPRNGG